MAADHHMRVDRISTTPKVLTWSRTRRPRRLWGGRSGDLARQARRRRQSIRAILDDLERLGYISRRPDPQIDVPTDRGVAFMRASDSIIREIKARHAARIGAPACARVK